MLTSDTCHDHWHCDPNQAAHSCVARDRRRPCPTCGSSAALTADTITDEQIRELLDNNIGNEIGQAAAIALHDNPHAVDYPTSTQRRRARARCAEILNARKAGAK